LQEWISFLILLKLLQYESNSFFSFADLRHQPTALGITPPQKRVSKIGKDGIATGKGGRKTATALAYIREGTGLYQVNGKPLVDYFPQYTHRAKVVAPLLITESFGRFDVNIVVKGGGVHGTHVTYYCVIDLYFRTSSCSQACCV
jgi:hypothetical protein